MQIKDWGLQIADCRLQIGDWGLEIGDWGLTNRRKREMIAIEAKEGLAHDQAEAGQCALLPSVPGLPPQDRDHQRQQGGDNGEESGHRLRRRQCTSFCSQTAWRQWQSAMSYSRRKSATERPACPSSGCACPTPCDRPWGVSCSGSRSQTSVIRRNPWGETRVGGPVWGRRGQKAGRIEGRMGKDKHGLRPNPPFSRHRSRSQGGKNVLFGLKAAFWGGNQPQMAVWGRNPARVMGSESMTG